MNSPLLNMNPETLALDSSEAREAGRKFGESYRGKEPYPCGCIDNFLPENVLNRVIADLQSLPEADHFFDRAQEKLKTCYIPERLPAYSRSLFYALNSRPFLFFLKEMTGIKGLIPDPYFQGGGIHSVGNGGHLDIHADFNHHSILNLERRLNVLIYLNKDWREDYGGSFEIWSPDMSRKVEGFVPKFNRMCCFNTSSDSWYGNPEPVNHPEGKARMSIATYYYTATWDDTRRSHTTLFRTRQGTQDQPDRVIARREFLLDVLPPVIHRKVAGRMQRFGF